MQKHQEGYLVPLLLTSTCSSVLSPELFLPKSIMQTRKASICCCFLIAFRPASSGGALQPTYGLSLGICPPVTQDGSRQAPSSLSPSTFSFRGVWREGGWWLAKGTKARSRVRRCRAGLSGGLVESSSQFNLLFSPGAGGNLTLLSSEVTEYFLSSPFCLCLFKQQALQRLTCAFFVQFPAHLAILDKVPRPDCSKK